MKMVALLRGINVGGNKRVPMLELCALATKVGLTAVQHYINSGNLVFDAGKMKPEQVAVALEKAIEKHFSFQVEVIVRTAAQWKKYAANNPFSSAARDRPHLLHLGLSKLPFASQAIQKLEERALSGEKIKPEGNNALWVDFAASVVKSKLTPALFDKVVGSTVTMRNWNTVLKLDEMLSARPSQSSVHKLKDLAGIGKAMLKDFDVLGIRSIEALAKADPKKLYDRLSRITGVRQDPCVLDTFSCAVAQARDPHLPQAQRNWWWWSRKRKSASSTG